VAIRGFSGRLALAAGGAALVADLDVRPATLAGLIGALSLPSPQGDHGRKEAAGLALAASAALHEDDLAELVGPKGAAAGGLRCRIEAEEDGDEVLTPGSLTWDTSSAQSLRAAEAAAWNKLLDASDRKKGLTNEAFASICTPLFARAEQARARVSYDLLCKLLLAAAGEQRQWSSLFVAFPL